MILWLLILQSVNLSIDPPDPHHDHIAEDLGTNDIESIIELVLEEVCNLEDAIQETQETDAEKSKSSIRYDLVSSRRGEITSQTPGRYLLKSLWNATLDSLIVSGTKPETSSPPPEGRV